MRHANSTASAHFAMRMFRNPNLEESTGTQLHRLITAEESARSRTRHAMQHAYASKPPRSPQELAPGTQYNMRMFRNNNLFEEASPHRLITAGQQVRHATETRNNTRVFFETKICLRMPHPTDNMHLKPCIAPTLVLGQKRVNTFETNATRTLHRSELLQAWSPVDLC